MMDTILSILSGSLSGALLVWLLRGWISERLQQSIRHEYSQKLETHKADLNARIQAIQHENQLQQLRTSLFFDHQRNAFADFLAKIAEVNQTWIDKQYHDEEGLTGPVPHDAYKDLRATFYKHQLFFDNECLAAIDLVLDCYSDSFSYVDGSGETDQRDINAAYESVQYLQPRLAELFQNRIGVSASHRAEREIALFGAIRVLNQYHFAEIELPPKSPLKLTYRNEPAEAVMKAESHFDELVAKLRQFETYLKRDDGSFHEAAVKTTRYLEMLSPSYSTNQKTE
ncbi:MAG: hypothetical protein Q6358_02080 [Candidatus Brocadiales bacterium]|nr:hypothetical protein [Candidatus Brocadiales bacterium]